MRSKFDDVWDGGSEQGSVAGEEEGDQEGDQEEQEDNTYIEDTPPESPVELAPELPPYLPALQGCRSVEEFHCLNRIEEGTYGVVYRARDKKIGRQRLATNPHAVIVFPPALYDKHYSLDMGSYLVYAIYDDLET